VTGLVEAGLVLEGRRSLALPRAQGSVVFPAEPGGRRGGARPQRGPMVSFREGEAISGRASRRTSGRPGSSSSLRPLESPAKRQGRRGTPAVVLKVATGDPAGLRLREAHPGTISSSPTSSAAGVPPLSRGGPRAREEAAPREGANDGGAPSGPSLGLPRRCGDVKRQGGLNAR